MRSIQDQEQGYRRGLVLGLTMAEIAILVIFVLLLVLGALLTRQSREAEQLRRSLGAMETNAAEIERISAAIGNDPDAIIQELARAKETERRLVIVESEAARLTELEQAIEAVLPAATTDRPIPDQFRELILLRDAVVDAGIAAEPEKLQDVLAEAAAAAETLHALGGENPAAIAEENARMARENDNLRAQIANLRRQAAAGGRGIDHPPCWATPEGRAEYIFDVALTSRGLIIRDRAMPHRAADRAELPLSGLTYGSELTSGRFLAMTDPLFQWSDAHECRFSVRAFDVTGPTEKEPYRRHMQVLEQRFYKYEVLNEHF